MLAPAAGPRAAEEAHLTSGLRAAFGPFGSRVWLDCAHQGPLPRVAVDEAQHAIQRKVTPHLISELEDFTDMSRRMRQSLARLLAARPEQIILGNSASYGMTLLANGLGLSKGDEVLLIEEDFPVTRLPFERLRADGVGVRTLSPRRAALDPERLRREMGSRTRVLCTSWVDSFSGHRCDLRAVGEACRDRGVTFIVNGSQAVGAEPIRPQDLPVDALVSCGYKWLCGPYGTGFCWVDERLLSRLECLQANWLAGASSLENRSAGPRVASRAELFDVFDTANFFNFMPWRAAVDLLVDYGVDRVAAYDRRLVERLLDGIDRERFEVMSPVDPGERSAIVILSHRHPGSNAGLQRKLKHRGIDVSLRHGLLRIAPHVYNSPEDIDALLAILNGCPTSPADLTSKA